MYSKFDWTAGLAGSKQVLPKITGHELRTCTSVKPYCSNETKRVNALNTDLTGQIK